MATTRDNLMAIISEKYPKLFMRTTEEFDGTEGGIWSSGEPKGEDEIVAKDKFRLFNYYADDYENKRYFSGVHKEMHNFLKKHGWYSEWYDAGTIMFWIDE